MLFGSHLYGLNNENSDIDYKSVFIQTLDELLLYNPEITIKDSTGAKDTKNSAGDIDNENMSLAKFFKLAISGQTMALDMLHAPQDKVIKSSWVWDELVNNREKLYTKDLNSFVGYVKRQANKYGIRGSRLSAMEKALEVLNEYDDSERFSVCIDKMPINEYSEIKNILLNKEKKAKCYEICGKKYVDTSQIIYVKDSIQKAHDAYGHRAILAKNNEGVDWKAISHALRAGYQARDIYLYNGFSFPLKETDFLKSVKLGKLDYLTEVAPTLESLIDEVGVLSEDSDYPDSVDLAYWEKLLLSIYYDVFGLKK